MQSNGAPVGAWVAERAAWSMKTIERGETNWMVLTETAAIFGAAKSAFDLARSVISSFRSAESKLPPGDAKDTIQEALAEAERQLKEAAGQLSEALRKSTLPIGDATGDVFIPLAYSMGTEPERARVIADHVARIIAEVCSRPLPNEMPDAVEARAIRAVDLYVAAIGQFNHGVLRRE